MGKLQLQALKPSAVIHQTFFVLGKLSRIFFFFFAEHNGVSSVFFGWLYAAAVRAPEGKCQGHERGQELPGATCSVVWETRNEETMKRREA